MNHLSGDSPCLVLDSASLITAAKFVVDGSTVLEHLSRCCLLTIPSAVHREVVVAGAAYPDAAQVQTMVTDGRIIVQTVEADAATVLDDYQLGAGEKESMILALTDSAVHHLVVDDRLAFIVSDRMTIPKILLADLVVELVWAGSVSLELGEAILRSVEPRYAQGFIPHTLTMLTRGERRCLR